VFAAEYGAEVVLPPDPSWDTEALEGARRYVQGLASRLRDLGIEAEGRAVIGAPAAAIAAAAEEVEADLIVMSTRALTGPLRTALGSTADEVVQSAGRPVLLVRRRGAAQEAASGAVAEAAVH
jgi:nucleotide-binding universal stress UspA family protein